MENSVQSYLGFEKKRRKFKPNFYEPNDSNIPVALCTIDPPCYPHCPPFDPSSRYPELNNEYIDRSAKNEVYNSIRQILISLELDKENIGTEKWNPFRDFVSEGGKVVIKPNLVSEPRSDDVDSRSVITHGSVLRPLIDYSLKAVGDGGEVIVADAPQFDSDFNRIVQLNGLSETLHILSERKGRSIPLIDLRLERVSIEDGIITRRFELNGDPLGYTIIDLGKDSLLNEIEEYVNRFKGSDYDRSETIYHHEKGRHEYFIAKTILTADGIISVPKLKTHKKAGVTLNLKNFIGINGKKNFIPHYRIGKKSCGGDEMADETIKMRLLSIAYELSFLILPQFGSIGIRTMKLLRFLDQQIVNRGNWEILRAGDWWGNDTIWRSVLDLYRIIVFANRYQSLQKIPQRSFFSVIDGVIAGEGNGPLYPRTRAKGIILGGKSLIAVDLAAIASMGYDFRIFPTYKYLQEPLIETSIDRFENAIEIEMIGNEKKSLSGLRESIQRPFDLPFGWKSVANLHKIY